MDFYRLFRIGPLRIYITTRRMKKIDRWEGVRQQHSRRLRTMRAKLMRNCGYCCQDCGRKFRKRNLEIHHIIPVHERPELIIAASNLRILCHDCHMKYHQKPQKAKVASL